MKVRAKRYSNGNTPFKTTRTFRGEVYENCQMDNSDMKIALGLDPKKHWPDEGVPTKRVLGILVWVDPKGTRVGGRGTRRCWAECPTCAKKVCAGHLGQHMASHIKG